MKQQEFFEGKVAIITGGASGIGREVAANLVRYGAKVVVADLNPTTLAEPLRSQVQFEQVDVTQAEQVQKLVDGVVAKHGHLDYMFNNAGIAIASELRDMNLEQWNRILDVNLKGVIHGILAAYPLMIKQGYGHIVNTASLAGLIPAPGMAAYSTTKYAMVGLSSNLRLEAMAFGVKVSVVCPGYIKTNIFDATTYVKTNKQDAMKTISFKLLEVDKAAQLLLQNVMKNKAVITMPGYAGVMWRLERLSPAVVNSLNKVTLNKLRKTRHRD